MNPYDFTITLAPGPAALLRDMAEGTNRCIEELAAAMLTDVLLDDARAHEPQPRVTDPVQMRIAKTMFQGGKDTVEVAKVLKTSEAEADRLLHADISAKGTRAKGKPAQKKTKRRIVTKTAAEIRHEARMRDPIVAAKKAGRPPKVAEAEGVKVVERALPAPVVPKQVVFTPPGSFTPAEDETIRMMRSLRAGPYDIASALKRDVNDVRKRISELWVRK